MECQELFFHRQKSLLTLLSPETAHLVDNNVIIKTLPNFT